MNEWDEFTGRLDAVESVEIRPRVSGYITEIHFQAGAIIKKDDLPMSSTRAPTRLTLIAPQRNWIGPRPS